MVCKTCRGSRKVLGTLSNQFKPDCPDCPMTTNPKPLLNLPIITRAELEMYDKKGWLHDRILTKHTIERMAELLERVLKYPYTVTGDTLLRRDITETLDTFNATGGEGS